MTVILLLYYKDLLGINRKELLKGKETPNYYKIVSYAMLTSYIFSNVQFLGDYTY